MAALLCLMCMIGLSAATASAVKRGRDGIAGILLLATVLLIPGVFVAVL